ncbi:hypothetical protein CPB84DRAFT_326065 [Gymnopilus junonius]|uniref:Uncharacterized protein n=1 Tax=Gymnopilus junonius TaxID=109634 RepID=A0A9P5ND82_GYMJU|nr:hypothetical protein CPB84DRAFT_326065 [Gymnopilus junonius]
MDTSDLVPAKGFKLAYHRYKIMMDYQLTHSRSEKEWLKRHVFWVPFMSPII